MASSRTFVLKLDPVSLKLLINLIIKKKYDHPYIGITIPLGECQMPKITIKREWKITIITHQGILSILQYGLY